MQNAEQNTVERRNLNVRILADATPKSGQKPVRFSARLDFRHSVFKIHDNFCQKKNEQKRLVLGHMLKTEPFNNQIKVVCPKSKCLRISALYGIAATNEGGTLTSKNTGKCNFLHRVHLLWHKPAKFCKIRYIPLIFLAVGNP